jgi:hypothetical protein
MGGEALVKLALLRGQIAGSATDLDNAYGLHRRPL